MVSGQSSVEPHNAWTTELFDLEPSEISLQPTSLIVMCWSIEMVNDNFVDETEQFPAENIVGSDCGRCQSSHSHHPAAFPAQRHIHRRSVCNLSISNKDAIVGLRCGDSNAGDVITTISDERTNLVRQQCCNICTPEVCFFKPSRLAKRMATLTSNDDDSSLSAESDLGIQVACLSPTSDHWFTSTLTDVQGYLALASCNCLFVDWCPSLVNKSMTVSSQRITPSHFNHLQQKPNSPLHNLAPLFANHCHGHRIELLAPTHTVHNLLTCQAKPDEKQGPVANLTLDWCGYMRYPLCNNLHPHSRPLASINTNPPENVFLRLFVLYHLARAIDCWHRLRIQFITFRLVWTAAQLTKVQSHSCHQSNAATIANTQRASFESYCGTTARHSTSSPPTLTLSAPTNGAQCSTTQMATKKNRAQFCSSRPKFAGILNWYALMLLAILSIHLNIKTCDAIVKIHQIKMPKFVENGTENSVVLDCIYSLDPKTDQNLVVKWFFNEDSEPIYQWIVELNSRHVPKKYEGRVNPNYRVNTTNPRQMYRALNLIRPTVDFNGRYSCHIISIFSQDSAEANLVVFAKTKSIDLVTRRVVKERSTALQQTVRHQQHNQSPLDGPPSPDLSNGWSSSSAAGLSSSWLFDQYGSRLSSASTTEIQCTVQNVYPLPELTIYQVLKDGLRPRSLENARLTQNVTQLPNGAFTVSVTAYIEDAELIHNQQQQQQQQSSLDPTSSVPIASSSGNSIGAPTIFECLVAQDEIRHELRNRTLYTPAFDDSDYDTSSSTALQHFIVLPILAMAVYLNRLLFA